MLYLFQGKIRGKKKNVGDQRREKGVKEGEGGRRCMWMSWGLRGEIKMMDECYGGREKMS